MNRRGFLATSLAACAAPAFVKSESLMGLWVPKEPKPQFWFVGDDLHVDLGKGYTALFKNPKFDKFVGTRDSIIECKFTLGMASQSVNDHPKIVFTRI